MRGCEFVWQHKQQQRLLNALFPAAVAKNKPVPIVQIKIRIQSRSSQASSASFAFVYASTSKNKNNRARGKCSIHNKDTNSRLSKARGYRGYGVGSWSCGAKVWVKNWGSGERQELGWGVTSHTKGVG